MAVDRANRTEIPGLEQTPYRFVREIGRGGMGSVHEVEHHTLGKRFVMKVLHENLAHREDFALRMQSEWRTLAKLEHPAIVQVTDAGRTSEGLPYFVMERLDGQTVAEALRSRGRMPAVEAAELMVVVLSGLEAAHATGAIHRDIKPQNLFLTARGPKILDFGIAKSKRKDADLVTRSGVAIGTPRYMAPEQAAGLGVDGRADIYACGLVLFELIAGRDPYSHLKDQAALVGAHINEPAPRLDDLVTGVPAPLGDLLQRWLAKDPADRPASARLARIELEALAVFLVAAGEPQATRVLTSEVTLARRQAESTAGATGDSASVDPTLRPSAPSAGGAPSDTVSLSAPWAALSEDDPPPDQGPPRGPSVTPPPLAQPAGIGRRRAPSRWIVAALGLLSLSALGFGALVLRPPAAAESPGHAEFEFPETEAPSMRPTRSVVAPPGSGALAASPPAPSAAPEGTGPRARAHPKPEIQRSRPRSRVVDASAPPPGPPPAQEPAPVEPGIGSPDAGLPGSGLW